MENIAQIAQLMSATVNPNGRVPCLDQFAKQRTSVAS